MKDQFADFDCRTTARRGAGALCLSLCFLFGVVLSAEVNAASLYYLVATVSTFCKVLRKCCQAVRPGRCECKECSASLLDCQEIVWICNMNDVWYGLTRGVQSVRPTAKSAFRSDC